ncbi:MAG: 50S ribosomal protein L30e [Candidatus Aenigmatarchaeota archaeon]
MKELKDALKEKKVVIGSKATIKHLKLGNVKIIVLANNCQENIRNDIEHYAKSSGIEVKNFDGTAKQLGVFCGKPFAIASLAIVSK